MAKTFRPSKKRPEPVCEEFTLVVLRDDVEEEHKFRTRAVIDAAGLTSALGAARDPEKAMTAMMRLMAKMLDNADGTPHGWTPKVVRPEEDTEAAALVEAVNATETATAFTMAGRPIELEPELEPEEEPEPARTMFLGPDDNLYTYADVQAFLPFEKGSSRRRWRYLLEEDDDVSVDAEQLRDVFEWLVSLAARRPTVRSS